MLIKLLLALGAISLLGRRMLLMLSAELGRKSDLTRRVHRLPDGFQFAVLIPVLRPEDAPALGGLLRTLLSQDYPAEQTQITVLTHPLAQDGLLALEQATRDRIHWLHAAEGQADLNDGKLLVWGTQRIIASGGQNRLFVFLSPTDILRDDFLSQVALKGTHMTVMQGYTALKRLPQTMVSRAWALSQRLFNRIDQAGRYHLGLSAQLQPSGWVIHQDILEKVPMERFLAAFPKEYGIVLARCGYRVHWAPSVVVYQEEAPGFLAQTRVCIDKGLAQLWLACRQLLPTLQLLVIRPTQLIQTCDHLLSLMAWPPVAFGGVVALAWLAALLGWLPEAPFWACVALSLAALNIASVVLARASLHDLIFAMTKAPLVYVATALSVPVVSVLDALSELFQPRPTPFEAARETRLGSAQTQPSSRTQRVLPPDLSDASLATSSASASTLGTTLPHSAVPQDALDRLANDIHGPAPSPLTVPLMGELPPSLQAPQTVLLSHGKTTIECRIWVRLAEPETIDGPPRYRLELAHKGASFETLPYPHLDDAFEDLRGRLAQRGFAILSCGSCAYFYNPRTPNHPEVQLEGLCLQGKTGQFPQDIHDTVHVLSPRCAHYTDCEARNQVVSDWKGSLMRLTDEHWNDDQADNPALVAAQESQ